jgi:hypothetical protein
MLLKGKPAGESHRIVCTGCGKKAFEAGIAVDPRAVEVLHNPVGNPAMIITDDEFKMQPLCEDCVAILSRGDGD